MKTKTLSILAVVCFTFSGALAEDITTLDGTTYQRVKSVAVKPKGLFFYAGEGDSIHAVTVTFTNLPNDVREKYHCDSYGVAMIAARQNQVVNLNKSLAFSLAELDAAKKKAQAEHKLLGFIMEWDTMLVPAPPMGGGSDCALAHFYDVFKDNLVLVFVRHENELDKVPDAVKVGFNGPEEGGFAPNMAVVTADCSQFVCEIPYGGQHSNGAIRDQIFRQKIAVMKSFIAEHGGVK